jgi:hypothetical protein
MKHVDKYTKNKFMHQVGFIYKKGFKVMRLANKAFLGIGSYFKHIVAMSFVSLEVCPLNYFTFCFNRALQFYLTIQPPKVNTDL